MKRVVFVLSAVLLSAVGISSVSFAESFDCQEGTNALINPVDYKLSCIPENIVRELKKDSNAITGECPEGMISMINTENYDRVCLPKSLVMSQVVTAKDAKKTASGADNTQSSSTPAEISPSEPAAAETTPSVPTTALILTDEEREYAEYLARDGRIAAENKAGGASLAFGMGYSLVAALDLRLEAGYQFQTNTSVAFGLYASTNLRVGIPLFTMDAAFVPKIHVFKNSFRFSLGFGLGIFYAASWLELWDGDDGYYDVNGIWHKEDKDNLILKFQFRPELNFDWFLSEHAWIGFGFNLPLIISSGQSVMWGGEHVDVWFDLFLHVGYKF